MAFLTDQFICQTKWRDLLICLAALAILAIIALPSLLLNHPDTRSEEKTSTPVEKEAARVRYQELLVREPVHPVEGTNPEFWLASSKQWLADQVSAQVEDFFSFSDFWLEMRRSGISLSQT